MANKKEIPALSKLAKTGKMVVTPSICYSCPECGIQMINEYNFDDSEGQLICMKCKKVYRLMLKEIKCALVSAGVKQ